MVGTNLLQSSNRKYENQRSSQCSLFFKKKQKGNPRNPCAITLLKSNMASEKNCSKEESTSSTSIATKGEHSGTPSVINTFANDGSFLELFKKRMEEESKKSKASEKSVSEDNVETKVKEDFEQNQTEGKVPGSTKMLAQQVWFSAKKNAYIFPLLGKIERVV